MVSFVKRWVIFFFQGESRQFIYLFVVDGAKKKKKKKNKGPNSPQPIRNVGLEGYLHVHSFEVSSNPINALKNKYRFF